jgi:hypothetical protein
MAIIYAIAMTTHGHNQLAMKNKYANKLDSRPKGKAITILLADGSCPVIPLNRLTRDSIWVAEMCHCFFVVSWTVGVHMRSMACTHVPDDIEQGSPSRGSAHLGLPCHRPGMAYAGLPAWVEEESDNSSSTW